MRLRSLSASSMADASADAALPSAGGAEAAAAAEESSIEKEMECDGEQ